MRTDQFTEDLDRSLIRLINRLEEDGRGDESRMWELIRRMMYRIDRLERVVGITKESRE